MSRWFARACLMLLLLPLPAGWLTAQEPSADAVEANPDDAAAVTEAEETAEVVVPARPLREPQVLEGLVDRTLDLAQVSTVGNTPAHYGIAAAILAVAFVLRRVVVRALFRGFVHLAGRTRSALDERLVQAMERPAMTLVTLVGLVAALRVLKLPRSFDVALTWVSSIAFSLLVLVTLLRLLGALLDHAQQRAQTRQLSVAVFMPWIRRTVLALAVVIGVLLVAQSLGANVRAFLAGLGIGGLAVALAAQDTLANIFGSVVIAIDQPFRVGETVQIGPHIGTVEDMGLRSTRLRTPGRHLITIPNKTVAAEAISNLTRFTARRVEQTLRLNYDAQPEALQNFVDEARGLILAETEVDPGSVIVHFTEFGATSLDVWVVYQTRGPDFLAQVRLKQRLNLALMRAVRAHGLAFAPNQRVQLAPTDDAAGGPAAAGTV